MITGRMSLIMAVDNFYKSAVIMIKWLRTLLQANLFGQTIGSLQKHIIFLRMFLIINGCTVLFMQCGFALLEAGAVRAKNVTNILMKNFLDACESKSIILKRLDTSLF